MVPPGMQGERLDEQWEGATLGDTLGGTLFGRERTDSDGQDQVR